MTLRLRQGVASAPRGGREGSSGIRFPSADTGVGRYTPGGTVELRSAVVSPHGGQTPWHDFTPLN